MKTAALKKNVFWIISGLIPVLVLLVVLSIWSGAGGTAGAEATKIGGRYDAVKGTTPKGTKAIEEWNDQKKVLDIKRQSLWEFNWKLQTGQIAQDGKPAFPPDPNPANRTAFLFRDGNTFKWPGEKNQYLHAMAEKYQKFGEKMESPNDEFNLFKQPDVYEVAYADAAKSILPTTFVNGSWKNALRHVDPWGDARPTDKQLWLALEDFWVQRGMLKPIKAVNDEAARFALAPETASAKLKRTFRSRVWDLELEVPETGPYAGKFVLAKLRNKTDRLQLLGVGRTMRLKIKLTPTGSPIDYRIEGDFVKAGGELVISTPVPRLHAIPLGTEVTEIAEVVQELDERTVPVRRVDFVAPGFKDARHAAATLKAPPFYPTPEVPVAATATPGGSGDGGLGGRGVPGGPAGPGGFGGAAGATPGRTGPPESVLDNNRERYLDVTSQVRRLPVAVVLLVDQMFMQDVLIQYANSPLRFQISQYHWKRFRGTLGSPTDPNSPSGASGTSGSGSGSDGGSGDAGITLPLSGGPGGRGLPGAGGFSPPSGPGPGPGPVGPMGPMGPGGFDPSGVGGSGGASGIAEGQVTSGLVELTVYGIVTLYEKYQDGSETAAPVPVLEEAPETPVPAPKPPTAPAPAPAPAVDPTKK